MIIDRTTGKEKLQAALSWTLCAVAALLAVLVLVDLATRGTLEDSVAAAADAAETNPGETPLSDRNRDLIEAIRKNNRFVDPPPKPQPPGQVLGILGDQACFPGGKWYRVGDTVPPGARVKKITATEVVIEWQGSERTLYPIRASIAETVTRAPQSKPDRSEPPAVEKTVEPDASRPDRSGQAPPPTAATGGDDLDWLDLPPHLKEYVRREWDKLSDKEKAEARRMYENAPPAMKEQMIRELEQQMDREAERGAMAPVPLN